MIRGSPATLRGGDGSASIHNWYVWRDAASNGANCARDRTFLPKMRHHNALNQARGNNQAALRWARSNSSVLLYLCRAVPLLKMSDRMSVAINVLCDGNKHNLQSPYRSYAAFLVLALQLVAIGSADASDIAATLLPDTGR